MTIWAIWAMMATEREWTPIHPLSLSRARTRRHPQALVSPATDDDDDDDDDDREGKRRRLGTEASIDRSGDQSKTGLWIIITWWT